MFNQKILMSLILSTGLIGFGAELQALIDSVNIAP